MKRLPPIHPTPQPASRNRLCNEWAFFCYERLRAKASARTRKGGRQCALTATRGRRDFFEEAIGDDNILAPELEQVLRQSKLDSYWMHDFVSFALCSIMPL